MIGAINYLLICILPETLRANRIAVSLIDWFLVITYLILLALPFKDKVTSAPEPLTKAHKMFRYCFFGATIFLVLISLAALLLCQSDKKKSTTTYNGTSFSCTYPADWNIEDSGLKTGREKLHLHIPTGGFINWNAYPVKNSTTLERWVQIYTESFPADHVADNPTHRVTELSRNDVVFAGKHGVLVKYKLQTETEVVFPRFYFFLDTADKVKIFTTIFAYERTFSDIENDLIKVVKSVTPTGKELPLQSK